jgi:excisionase family DNA binding protein
MSQPKTKPNRRPPAKSSDVLTLAEAAAYLRVAERDVLVLVREEGLPGRRVGDDWRFLKAAVDRWLGTPAAPERGQFWQAHFGALREDPYLADIVREAYRKRGRPADGEP